jgi:hypothetical protein
MHKTTHNYSSFICAKQARCFDGAFKNKATRKIFCYMTGNLVYYTMGLCCIGGYDGLGRVDRMGGSRNAYGLSRGTSWATFT